MSIRLYLIIAFTFLSTFSAPLRSSLAESPASPLTPQKSLEHFQLHPDCKIELAASEPQVIDPIAISFDEHGRLWVVEMRDYPYGPGEGETPKSRISVLQDADGDGIFETTTTFADELLFATGLQLWKDGAFVTVGGKILLLRDTDGDLKSDTQEVWYEGFVEQNSQLRANHPTLGMDGLIYVANGLRGGTIKNARNGGEPVELSGMDFAFNPHTGECQGVSGVGQFGLTFDRFGNRFVCSNRNPLKQIVIENRYVQRAKKTRLAATAHDAAIAGEDSRVYPISNFWTTSNLHAGQFTAACGVKIFGGTSLGEEFFGNAFTCEPTGNLLHREVFLESNSPALVSQPAREKVEFLASPDTWFRPVNTATGPDGCLYVVDMYRAVIEHPDWMPAELKKRPDLELGNDLGRIYRIVGANESDRNSVDENWGTLVEQLNSSNQWDVETAFRMIWQDQESSNESKSLIASLRGTFRDGKNVSSRLRAMWLLKLLDQIDGDELRKAFADSSSHVRRIAIVLSETLLSNEADGGGELPDEFVRLTRDRDPAVAFQAALSSMFFQKGKETWPDTLLYLFLEERSRGGKPDPWIEDAVLMATEGQTETLLETAMMDRCALVKNLYNTDPARLLAKIAIAAPPITTAKSLAIFFAMQGNEDPEFPRSFLARTIPSLRSRGFSAEKFRAEFDSHASDAVKESLGKWLDSLKELAVKKDADRNERVEAIQVIAYLANDSDALRKLALEESNMLVRITALDLLSGSTNAETWQKLIERFPEESPQIRSKLVSIAGGDIAVARLLLAAIESEKIASSEIDRVARGRLMKSSDTEVRALASKLLGSVINSDRAAVLENYQPAIKPDSDSIKGKQLFQKNCSACHRFGEIGNNVGPDISDTRVKTKEQLLHDILNPNGAIDANFISYMVQTVDGKSYAGVITSENAASITLTMAEGKTKTLLRSEIEEMASTGQSLMPEGFEKDISIEEMADLLSFLKNWRYLDGAIPFDEASE